MATNFAPEGDELELMATVAHDIWVSSHLKNGWLPGPIIDKENRIHTCLVHYANLSETDKESDRDFVRGTLAMLRIAGYEIVKSSAVDAVLKATLVLLGETPAK